MTSAPLLEMDAAAIFDALSGFRAAFPGVRAHFATKCNPDPGVLRVLRSAGCDFEIASLAEMRTLLDIGVPAAELVFSNPVRARAETAGAAAAGVQRFAADSEGELRRLADEAPGSLVYVRLATAVERSLVPSEGKFGVDVATAARLLTLARELALVPYGVTFHMGSQALSADMLIRPLDDVRAVLAAVAGEGIRPESVDIGGGFPARYDRPVPALAEFGRVVTKKIAELPYPVEVIAEPGRCLVAEAGTLRCRVIGVARRGALWWAHTDLGVFNGMMEVLESGGELRYPIRDSRGSAALRRYHITGPTCDGQDTFATDVPLSADLTDDDEILVGSAGAYTAAYASRFNGFAVPRVVLV
ncbi:MAG TPA: type III PLP-dependent enzyme [Actinoplanes sp.]|nr:type III PLP-dependent enzyme [Actinoplanes sp.]